MLVDQILFSRKPWPVDVFQPLLYLLLCAGDVAFVYEHLIKPLSTELDWVSLYPVLSKMCPGQLVSAKYKHKWPL